MSRLAQVVLALLLVSALLGIRRMLDDVYSDYYGSYDWAARLDQA